MRAFGLIVLVAATGVACASATRVESAEPMTGLVTAATDGGEIFQAVCSSCHSVDPPAIAAPPMSHVARHYREAVADEKEGIARIADWIGSPAVDRSLLPAHAVERWGLMPPLILSEEQRLTVAAHVWAMGAENAGHGGHRQHMHR